ncbi:MAG: peptidylprolyl isomerase [Robiginitomaculum sp.]|nr:MAG: peptidylprolyl isomerase [Robiginitomaculum sp.]
MKKFLPLLPLVAVCLFACGAAEQVEPAQTSDVLETTSDATASQASVSKGAAFQPVGAVDVSTMSTPEDAPDDWRAVAANQLVVLKTAHGVTLIELAPQFAPGHTARIQALASNEYFVGMPFHRVLKGFMAQAGDNKLVGRPEPTTENLTAEFRFRRSPNMKMIVTGERRSAEAGFIDGFNVASQNPALAMMTADGKVDAWSLHCPGAAAAARLGNDINSANAQFYITMGYPEALDKNYTVWGRVRAGLPAIFRIKRGEPVIPPDLIEQFALVSGLDAANAPLVWVMNTNSPAFSAYLETLKTSSGSLPDVCKIDVPVWVRWP